MITNELNVAAPFVTAREIKTNLSPSHTLENVSEWFEECASHRCCPKQLDSTLPTRVIDVTTLEVKTTDGITGKYAALSYCWGKSTQNYHCFSITRSCIRRLDFDGLPRTIKDAISVTRAIGVPYLWVDSLCIIQDDEADKIREISRMAQVYGDAHVTIVASSSNCATQGFLQPREPHNDGIAIPFRVGADRFGRATVQRTTRPVNSFWTNEIYEPIDERAWTLQEQLLARRLLLYASHTLQWRCAAGTKNLGQSLNVTSCYRPGPKLLSQISVDPEEAYQEWLRIVQTYSLRSASLQSDKLPAIAALAERFAPVLGDYYAGIWSYAFIRQLTWQHAQMVKPDFDRTVYRAPSWSWASIDGEILYARGDFIQEVECTRISVKTTPKDREAPYGEVTE
ncbi:heterokaryon incompatibility protein-domain-containing protein [Phaeosphaeria sp. MPI-PUGE-AT-0046c]|nr:heterokaryon incompatibility protein-domain-containing protein [Phaeosphaeria sp. MPI-PUGE-AT-0046c]